MLPGSGAGGHLHCFSRTSSSPPAPGFGPQLPSPLCLAGRILSPRREGNISLVGLAGSPKRACEACYPPPRASRGKRATSHHHTAEISSFRSQRPRFGARSHAPRPGWHPHASCAYQRASCLGARASSRPRAARSAELPPVGALGLELSSSSTTWKAAPRGLRPGRPRGGEGPPC